MKSCTECGKLKDIDQFYKNKKMADGHLNKCISCFSLYKKQYWIENKERLKEYKKRHRKENFEHYKAYAKRYREENIESIKEKERARKAENKEQISRYNKDYARTESGKSIKNAIQKKYSKTEKGKAVSRRMSKVYHEDNPKIRRCHGAVRRAVKRGALVAPGYCENCGAGGLDLHAHHDDYSFPLAVRWLCVKCHQQWHKINGQGLNAR